MSLCVPAFADSGSSHEEFSFSFTIDPIVQEISVSQNAIRQIIDEESDFSSVYNQAVSDLEVMFSKRIDPSICTPVDILNDGKILYELFYPNGVINQAYVSETPDGYAQVDFFEDEKHDTVIYLPNGNLLVNGELVACSQNNSISIMSIGFENAISPRARYSEYRTTPWGNDSEYSIYVNQATGNKCSWGVSTIVGMTVSAVTAILCVYMSAGLGLSIFASVLSTLASAMISYATIYGMDDAYFSWKFDIYKRDGFFPLEYYYKYTGACYSRQNCQGEDFPHTFYYHNYFS